MRAPRTARALRADDGFTLGEVLVTAAESKGPTSSSKIGREAIVTFCHLKDLTAFITDREPPKEYVDLCHQENVKLRYE